MSRFWGHPDRFHRLNLTQAFNSLGTTIAPWVGGLFILSAAAVARWPGGAAASSLSLTFFLPLPWLACRVNWKLQTSEDRIGAASYWREGQRLNLAASQLIFGAGRSCVCRGEVAIGSSIANYLALDKSALCSASTNPMPCCVIRKRCGLRPKYISVYWGGAMVGRYRMAVLQKVKTRPVLGFCAVMRAAGNHFCAQQRSGGDVVDPIGGLLQLDHVPSILHWE